MYIRKKPTNQAQLRRNMLIDFNEMKEIEMPCMNGGNGMMRVRMFNDDSYRIIPTVIRKGASIGLHKQDSGDDLNYILSGNGKAICDGKEEILKAGVMHICPKARNIASSIPETTTSKCLQSS